MAVCGWAGLVRLDVAGTGTVGLIMAGMERQGLVWQGTFGQGKTRQAWKDRAERELVGSAWQAGKGWSRHVKTRYGMAGTALLDSEGMVWQGMAGAVGFG